MANLGNKRPENHKEKTKFFGKGINNKSSYEIQGAINNDNYLYSRNGRVSSIDSIERISGEVSRYVMVLDSEDENDYFCIGSIDINNFIVAFWASVKWQEDALTEGIITINGDIVCMSDKLPLRHIHRLCIDKNENCLGGEVFITDNNLPPMYFNIQDLIDNFNSGSQKYFSEFDYKNYTINILNSLEVLVFTELRNVGGGNGRPVGQEVYSFRAVSDDGDKTNWSVSTPMIEIPRNYVNYENPNNLFKYASTRGDDTDKDSRTAYAPVLKLRIDNTQGYNYIEVKRTSYNNGESLGYTPNSYIIQRIPIVNNQFNIIEIVDSLSNETDNITVAPSDDTGNVSSIIKKAEALRYFKNKIELANIEYEEVDVNNLNLEYREVSGKIADPVLKFLGEIGHRDPINSTYFRSHLSGEKESFCIVLWNQNLERTFVIPIDELDNFAFPDKRKNMDGFPESINLSDYLNKMHKFVNPFSAGSPMYELPSQDTNEVEEVFEVVLSTASALEARNFPSTDDYVNTKRPSENDTPIVNITENALSGSNQYNIRNPKSDKDTTSDFDRNYSALKQFDRGVDYDTSVAFPGTSSFQEYRSDGFCKHYQSLGLGIHGISGFPDWCRAFSIAKTKPAKRVIAQGLAVYPLVEKGNTIANNTAPGGDFDIDDPVPGQNEPSEAATPSDSPPNPTYQVKGMGMNTLRQVVKEAANKVHVHIPDFDSSFLPQQLLDEMIQNPQNYKLQFVEPVGFWTEPFAGDLGIMEVDTVPGLPLNDWIGEKNDIVTHANVQYELLMPLCGAELLNASPLSSYYAYFSGNRFVAGNVLTGLGGWLGGQLPSAAGWKTQITNITLNTDNDEGLTFLEIEVEDDVWLSLYMPFAKRSIDDDEVKGWHEHFYIINIVNDSAEIPELSNQEFLAPINFIKLESKVGISYGLNSEQFETNNERIEDFQVVETTNEVNFVYIRKPNRDDLRFINITEIETYFPGDIATIDSDIDNGTTIYCGEVLNGKYKTSGKNILIDDLYSYTLATIGLNKLNKGDEVYVKYNNQKPISVFGGDIMHNTAVFPYKHRHCIGEGRHVNPKGQNLKPIYPQSDFGNQFKLGIGFPAPAYKISTRTKKHIYFDAMPKADNISSYWHTGADWDGTILMNYIRQWLILYTCQARTNLSLAYGDFYPNLGYVERPLSWESEKSITENKIFSRYDDDYPNEKERWTLGGFRINQLAGKNLDFSKTPEHDKLYARVVFLQEESQRYCNRIAWSQTRPIQNYGSPSLKTFRPFNYKDISDKHGDIRALVVISDNKGDNLYAMCENDIALVLTSKHSLSDASGNLIATSVDDSSFISEDIWNNIGQGKGLQKLHKWSLVQNGNSVFFCNENGVFEFSGGQPKPIYESNHNFLVERLQENIGNAYYVDGEGIILECLGYSFYDNKFKEYCYCIKYPYINTVDSIKNYEDGNPNARNIDISNANGFILNITEIGQYVDNPSEPLLIELRNTNIIDTKVFYILWTISSEVAIRVYNGDSYYEFIPDSQYSKITITPDDGTLIEDINKELLEDMAKLYVYCDENEVKAWSSEFDYRFDSVVAFNGKKFGLKELVINELEKGDQLNGENIEFELVDVINSSEKEEVQENKEWVSIQVNTKAEIDKNSFSIDFYNKETGVPFNTIQGVNMRYYGGYWQYIPRDLESSKRYQSQYLLYNIKYNGEGSITIVSVKPQYKILK